MNDISLNLPDNESRKASSAPLLAPFDGLPLPALPLGTADFASSRRGPDLAGASFVRCVESFRLETLQAMYGNREQQLLIGPASSDAVQSCIPSLIEAYSKGECIIETCAVERVGPRLMQSFKDAGFSMAQEVTVAPLVQEIVADARRFASMLQLDSIGFRFIVDAGELMVECRESIARAELTQAIDEWKESLVYFAYNAAFVYHRDEHPVNQITCYSGAGTLCLAPDALNSEELNQFGNRWIEHTLSETGVSSAITSALESGNRELALLLFDELLTGIALQQNFREPYTFSGNRIQPYSFPKSRACLYFGDQQLLDPTGARLLMHARPMPLPGAPSEPRVLCIFEVPAGVDMRDRICPG